VNAKEKARQLSILLASPWITGQVAELFLFGRLDEAKASLAVDDLERRLRAAPREVCRDR